ncbi:hypothetical protein DUI87_18242 [Hirundo rustica rustica]|uniref:Uncharacterized protein n=1 Tax=Hirundo rustica rustica TaxID=333673 RepID=A0A3M0JY20_HIRRU|nr:hypothetical protein DUI87_18242 [Hirundo rustica rustica]
MYQMNPVEHQKGILALYFTVMTTQLESCVQLWSPQHRKGVDLLEQAQKIATKLIRVVENFSKVERIGPFSLDKRRFQEDRPYCSLSVLEEGLEDSC